MTPGSRRYCQPGRHSGYVASITTRRAGLDGLLGDLSKTALLMLVTPLRGPGPYGRASVHDPLASTEADPLNSCRMLWTVALAVGHGPKSENIRPARRLTIEVTMPLLPRWRYSATRSQHNAARTRLRAPRLHPSA